MTGSEVGSWNHIEERLESIDFDKILHVCENFYIMGLHGPLGLFINAPNEIVRCSDVRLFIKDVVKHNLFVFLSSGNSWGHSDKQVLHLKDRYRSVLQKV